MINYSFKKEWTIYDWQIKEREKREKEEVIEKVKEEAYLEEIKKKVLERYKNHAISEVIKERLVKMEKNIVVRKTGCKRWSHPVYILDSDKNIIDLVSAKNGLCDEPIEDEHGHIFGYTKGWLSKNSTFKKGFSRRLIYTYVKEQKLYKDMYYFIPVDEYEKFIEKN